MNTLIVTSAHETGYSCGTLILFSIIFLFSFFFGGGGRGGRGGEGPR